MVGITPFLVTSYFQWAFFGGPLIAPGNWMALTDQNSDEIPIARQQLAFPPAALNGAVSDSGQIMSVSTTNSNGLSRIMPADVVLAGVTLSDGPDPANSNTHWVGSLFPQPWPMGTAVPTRPGDETVFVTCAADALQLNDDLILTVPRFEPEVRVALRSEAMRRPIAPATARR